MTPLFSICFLLYLFLFCSLTESVLLSSSKTYLTTIKEKEKWANSLLKLKLNIDRPLSAILSLNTIAIQLLRAGVGAESIKIFGEASLGIVSAILTILILVITEIIPKTIGARY